MSLFNYKLKPVSECVFPTTRSGKKSIAWFWLTDSTYYIQFGDVKLFEHSKEAQEKVGLSATCDEYPYIRQLEDFFDILPQVSAGIPEEIYRFVYTNGTLEWLEREVREWYERIEDLTTEQFEVFDSVSRFIWHGCLDTGYLRVKSRIFFYHVNDRLVIHYDFLDKDDNGVPIWSATSGKYEMTWQKFVDEIEDLLNRFFADMDKQVDDAIKDLMNEEFYQPLVARDTKKGTKINQVDYLRKEHADRKEFFYTILEKVKIGEVASEHDWNAIPTHINTIRKELRSMMLDRPRIVVDFNEMVGDNLILLSKEDSKYDSAYNLITFQQGMPVYIYSDDNLDEDDKIDCIIADGIAVETPPELHKNYEHVKWCCKLVGEIRFMSDKE